MHILLMADRIPPDHIGGAGKIAWAYALGYAEAGHQVSILTTTSDATYQTARAGLALSAIHAAYPARWRAWLSLYNPQTVPSVRRLLDDLRPDAIHAHNVHTGLSYAALCAAHARGIPVTLTAHDVMSFAYGKLAHHIAPERCPPPPEALRLPPLHNLRQMRARYNPLRNHVIWRILRRCVRHRVAVSGALQAALHANGLPPFDVVHNGLDLANVPQPSPAAVATLRERLKLIDHPVILFSGRLTAEKGGPQLLAAFDRLLARVPAARLLLLTAQTVPPGWYADLSNVRAEHIVTTGWLTGDDLWEAYALADVVAVPSAYLDPFPTVVLEAMAQAKPVLASCYSGAREAVRDGETGYLINPYHVEDVADKALHLLTHPDQAKVMGEAGRAHLAAHFTQAAQVERMLGYLAD